MSNYFSATKKINPRGITDDVLEIFVDTYDIYRLNNLVAELGTYTFVVWYCSAADCSIKFNVLGTEETVASTTTWTKYIKTVEYDGTNNNIDITQDLDSTIYLYEGYITKGSKDKSWSLAPEDWEDGREERDELITETMTFAQQTSDMFKWVVKSGTNETDFILTDRTATLVSEQINLKGLVTFTGLSSEVPTEIIGTLSEQPIISEDGSGTTVATVIHGGWIKTGTIDSNQLNVNEIFANGTSVMNIIDARELNADNITSGTIKANFLELYGLEVKQADSDIVTLSIENTGDVTLRGSVESYNYISGESGWSINKNGNAEFNDVVVRGSFITDMGGIADMESNDVQVLYWAGASHEERENAPFVVYSDGSMKATKGTFSGVFTGDIEIGNISIIDPSSSSGNDAILTIQNGDNGVKRVQLRDTNYSSFAQDIWITDDFENSTIQLSQNGYIDAIGGVITQDNSLTGDGLNIGGATISGDSTNMNIISTLVNVGTYNSDSNLKVFGGVTVEKDTKLNKDLLFGNIMIASHHDDGIDFNFINDNITFTVTFVSNGGSSVAPIRNVVLNSKITKPTDPIRNGYTFNGWYKDSLLNVAFNFDSDVIDNNITLYAKWTMIPAVAPTYTIIDAISATGKYGELNVWTTPYTINATTTDSGTLSYHWDIDLLEGSGQLTVAEDIFANKITNNISVDELTQYLMYHGAYSYLSGTCTITNTKGNTIATTVVSVYIEA